MSERIGVYNCHCGINIAGRVRVKEVAEFAATLPNVAVSRDYLFMCSDPGQELIEKDIKEHNLNRVVVAACSPRMHEKTFQDTCRRAGLNPYYFRWPVFANMFPGLPMTMTRPRARPKHLWPGP